MDFRNIIFMDAEFAKLKPDGIDLLSIGLIKFSGEELYIELDYKGEVDEWVENNVVPNLISKKISLEDAAEKIKNFVGDSKPYMISYVNQFDWMGVCKLFDANNPQEIGQKVPFHWVPIDFSTMLFERGYEPGTCLLELAKNFNIEVSQLKEHNALDDVLILKHLYERIILDM